jgi:hypothetical protein
MKTKNFFNVKLSFLEISKYVSNIKISRFLYHMYMGHNKKKRREFKGMNIF